MDAQLALEVAERIASFVAATLGQSVQSIILHGSLESGAYEPGRSDIDLLVVVDTPLEPAVKHKLFQGIRGLLAPSPPFMDLRVVDRTTAGAPPRLPVVDLEIAAHPPSNVLEVVAEGVADADLLVELAVARSSGLAIYGRRSAEVIGPVERVWLLEDADQQLATWQRVHAVGHVGTIVPLTACRMWRYAAEGAFCSKPDAARWVLDRAPDCDIVLEALRAHQGERDPERDCVALAPLLAQARAAVRQTLAHYSDAPLSP